MRHTQILQGLAAVLCIAGCVGHAPVSQNAACQRNIDAECLIDLALVQAVDIANANDCISAQLDIASAQQAANRPEDATSSIALASQCLSDIEDDGARVKVAVQIVTHSANSDCLAFDAQAFARSSAEVAALEDLHQRADLHGKLIAAAAVCVEDDPMAAVQQALAMPESDTGLASYKARTLSEIAPVVARENGVDAAEVLLDRITMGLPYYRATAASEVARVALADGDVDSAKRVLAITTQVGDEEQNGYFKGAMYREAAGSYQLLGEATTATELFARAADVTELAPSLQEHARSLSRVATVMSDFKRFSTARALLPAAFDVASDIEDVHLRAWAYYEIAGGAAFSGDFDTALRALDEIPEILIFSGNVLLSSARRDVAWGYAKHGRTDEALQMASGIVTLRERVQALSRIARVLLDPDMHALPRYL